MSNARSGIESVGCYAETPEEDVIMPDTDAEVFCDVARLLKEMASDEPSNYLAIEIELDMANQIVTEMTDTALPGAGFMRPFRRFSLESVQS